MNVVYIGEAFGKEEARQGKAFVGKSGTELWYWSPLKREEVKLVTNLLWYQPPKNRDPKPEEVAAEWPRLMGELEDAEPDLIVSFGRIPSSYLAGYEVDISKVHGLPLYSHSATSYHPSLCMGFLHDLYKQGLVLFPCYHPASVFHNPDNYRWFYQDLSNLEQYLDGELDWSLNHGNTTYGIETCDWGHLDRSYDVLALDTESDSQRPICLTYSSKPGEAGLIYAKGYSS